MIQSKHQRIGVFVDAQNMYYSAKDFYQKKVDFNAILKEAIKGRSLIRAMVYVIRADMKEEGGWFDKLKSFGYEVRSKDLQTFIGGHKKGDWDIGIAMDMIELAPKLDTLVLVSGDGDFIPLVEHLRRALGCRVELIAFGKSASSKLIEVVDSFTDLGKATGRYLRSSTIHKSAPRQAEPQAAAMSAVLLPDRSALKKPAPKPADAKKHERPARTPQAPPILS
ncbi:MAG: NYN domain-containing protein [Nanoarchaeota archaeon]